MHTLAMHQTVSLTEQETHRAPVAIRRIDGRSRRNHSDDVEMPLRIDSFAPLVVHVRVGRRPPSEPMAAVRPSNMTPARAQGAS